MTSPSEEVLMKRISAIGGLGAGGCRRKRVRWLIYAAPAFVTRADPGPRPPGVPAHGSSHRHRPRWIGLQSEAAPAISSAAHGGGSREGFRGLRSGTQACLRYLPRLIED